MNQITEYNETIFENIKHIDEYGNEYWEARELMPTLKYSKWGNFKKVIDKAKIACEMSGNIVNDCFADVGKPITSGKGKIELIEDYKLSRYACYLIVQNADPRKEVVALGQTYFAFQTKKMELTEDEKRLYRRNQKKDGNKVLYRIAIEKGVKNFDKFTDAGYKGLYNGETANDIARRKNIRYREDILDNMGSAELGANIFRIIQTEALLEKQKIPNENKATNTHYNVAKEIRNTIKRLGGTMPEDLSTPKKTIKRLEEKNV